MRVLNIEDNAMKHADICRVLKNCGITDVCWKKNLEDALIAIDDAQRSGELFDLIVTDMSYPYESGASEREDAGERLIEAAGKRNVTAPIIVCSSLRLRIPEILGTVYYSQSSDWQTELAKMIRQL